MQKSEFYNEARANWTGPLAGVRVLEATTTWAGPMCGCMLADFGADVIKVEHPLGEIARRSPPLLPGTEPPVSFMHATLNRNKRSLSLDLRRDQGREIFLKLAERSDNPSILLEMGDAFFDLRAKQQGLGAYALALDKAMKARSPRLKQHWMPTTRSSRSR